MKLKLLERTERLSLFLTMIKSFVYDLVIIFIFISVLMFWVYIFTYSDEWRDLSIYMIQLFRTCGAIFVFLYITSHFFSFLHNFLYRKETLPLFEYPKNSRDHMVNRSYFGSILLHRMEELYSPGASQLPHQDLIYSPGQH